MATKVVRFISKGGSRVTWGVVFGQKIAPLDGSYKTTGQFVKEGLDAAYTKVEKDAVISIDQVEILSPITQNQQFLCQGINYRSHVRESGVDVTQVPFNMFFTKASSCITGPYAEVIRPKHVKLLDYEIELGLVMKADVFTPKDVRPDQLHEYLAGVTIVNDVSARDVQLPQIQFYKGKSYRTFGPVGPYLLLLNREEWSRWGDLKMTLSVNGEIRQSDRCGNMIHKPHASLSELTRMHDLNAGDLIATGTPAGCAAKAPGKASMFIAKHLLSDLTKWQLFIKSGLSNPHYLKPNDVMELAIKTDDGKIDLGHQRNRVVSE